MDLSQIFAQSLLTGGVGGDPALNAFEKTLNQNNYWNMAAAPVMGMKFDTSTWNPGTTLAATAGQSFLGAMLQGLGAQSNARQIEAASQILPQLYADPVNTVIPDTIDAEAGAGLRISAARENQLRAARAAEAAAASRNSIAERIIASRPDIAAQLVGPELEKMGATKTAISGMFTPPDPLLDPNSAAFKNRTQAQALEQDYTKTLTTGDEAKKALALNRASLNIFKALEKDSPLAASTAILEYAKLQDPMASVRENDELRVSDPGGPLGQLAQYYSIIKQEGKLVPEAKAALRELVPLLQDSQFDQYNAVRDIYLDKVKNYGGSPDNVGYIKQADLSGFLVPEEKSAGLPINPDVPPGMKEQRNKVTGEIRIVPQ